MVFHGWGLTNELSLTWPAVCCHSKRNLEAIEDSFMEILKTIPKSDMFLYTRETWKWVKMENRSVGTLLPLIVTLIICEEFKIFFLSLRSSNLFSLIFKRNIHKFSRYQIYFVKHCIRYTSFYRIFKATISSGRVNILCEFLYFKYSCSIFPI